MTAYSILATLSTFINFPLFLSSPPTAMHCTRTLYKAAISRVYQYDLSIHGALFLSSTPISRRATITSYRDPNFLRIFYARLRRNEENDELRKEGFEWVSHCAGEANFLRPAKDGSAIVYDDLVGEGASAIRYQRSIPCLC